MLDGIRKFLEYINQNWTTIVVIIGLLLAIYKKAKSFFDKTTDEKIAVAKEQLQEIILKLVSDAEEDYEEWVKAGEIKRSQVIQEIYTMYPILEKVADQKEIIDWIDQLIKDALVTLRQIIVENAPMNDSRR